MFERINALSPEPHTQEIEHGKFLSIHPETICYDKRPRERDEDRRRTWK